MIERKHKDRGQDALLDLAGEIYVQEGGHWVKVEARRVGATSRIPHGIRYSLTLHAPDGARIMGFDNAHGGHVTGRGSVRRVEYDHWHPEGRPVQAYVFRNGGQLLSDFFAEVDRVLKKRGVVGS